MANYVVLMNWTDQGIKSAKDTVKRSREAAKVFERMGSTLKEVYWTTGGYDLVAIVSAPDDETLAALLLSLAGAGNLRTHTLRAFTADEVTGILARMP